MARYQCDLCMQIYDEASEGAPFSSLSACPYCGAPLDLMRLLPDAEPEGKPATSGVAGVERADASIRLSADGAANPLAYPPELVRVDPDLRFMDAIHHMAVEGTSLHAAMATDQAMPGWDDLLVLGAQLDPLPLMDDEPVNLNTVIGPQAARPLQLDSPVFVSHMSFGALSREAKIALARGASAVGTAICSGEGGILPEEREAATRYIFEYVPNRYSVTEANLRAADAIEIKIGQGTKPGMGGMLPGSKVTEEIARIRDKPVGQDIISPSRFPDIRSAEDLARVVASLRELSGGRPIGVKIAAGRIERDLAVVIRSGADFVTLDARGGATGSSPFFVREATSVPAVHGLYRARRFLDAHDSPMSLIITGGLRVSSDIVRALALGADAVALASAALIAIGCQQYRICDSGFCPMGIATQDPELRRRLDPEIAGQRLANFLRVTNDELRSFARLCGLSDIHGLSLEALATTSREISEHTAIAHV